MPRNVIKVHLKRWKDDKSPRHRAAVTEIIKKIMRYEDDFLPAPPFVHFSKLRCYCVHSSAAEVIHITSFTGH
jgi:hypothetical protein